MKRWERDDKTDKRKRQIIGSVLVALMVTLLFCSRYKIIYVSGNSMQPALDNGSIILLDKWAVPHKGDLVVAHSEELGCDIVKRIVAEGESTISMEEGKLILNHEYVKETYLAQSNQAETWEEIKVPAGMYFLLGDNRMQSVDSRDFGCIDRSKIKGKVIFTLF